MLVAMSGEGTKAKPIMPLTPKLGAKLTLLPGNIHIKAQILICYANDVNKTTLTKNAKTCGKME